MDKYITHNVLVNGIEVNARYNYETVDNILIPLLQKLTNIQVAKKSRVLALFAAPPGTGKSTLLSFLERLAAERDDIGDVQIIGMDGFHMRQAYLTSHTIIRDGEEKLRGRLTERKALGMSSYEEAERFVEFSDLRNVRTCLACSSGADLVLEMVSDRNLIVVKD